MLHHFHTSVAGIPLPEKFTFPFCYTPHPLCVAAAKEVQDYLALQDAWKEELAQGKMFGVLVVKTQEGKVGYLAAFSGILAGKNMHPFFVPPVYDLLQPQGFFKKEEEQISQINARIRQLEEDETYRRQLEQLSALQQTARNALEDAKAQMKAAKKKREERRRKAASHPGFPLSPEEEKGPDTRKPISEGGVQAHGTRVERTDYSFATISLRPRSRHTGLESRTEGTFRRIAAKTVRTV